MRSKGWGVHAGPSAAVVNLLASLILNYTQKKTGLRKRITTQKLPPVTEWGDMVTMRGLRKNTLV